jgi:hypothetical protein
MATKITLENINSLKVGDVVAKYPIFGKPVNEIDFNKHEEMSVMQVGKINDNTIDLLFNIPENTKIGGMGVVMGPLHKSKSGMIEDNSWWKISN